MCNGHKMIWDNNSGFSENLSMKARPEHFRLDRITKHHFVSGWKDDSINGYKIRPKGGGSPQ